MVRSLSHRNYRLFFVGQGISVIGTWMTRVATGLARISSKRWRLDSAFMLGIVGFVSQVSVCFSDAHLPASWWIVGTVIIASLVITQILSLIQSAAFLQ